MSEDRLPLDASALIGDLKSVRDGELESIALLKVSARELTRVVQILCNSYAELKYVHSYLC